MNTQLSVDASVMLTVDDNAPETYVLLTSETFPYPVSCPDFDLTAVHCDTLLCFINSFGEGDAGQGAYDVVFDMIGIKVRRVSGEGHSIYSV